jgi:predicted O-linked N-acetylglucosamine transferase (SPINDLY family)
MGVPVVTLKGERFISHNGETIAHNAGQANWIANDANDYVRLALEAASDLEKLLQIRAALRAQVLASPLFDKPRFARNFEAAMLAMAAK